jgi:phosphatidylglycerophosphatase C
MIDTIAVFDFDGTITRGDTLVPLLASVSLARTLRHAPPAVLRARLDSQSRDAAKARLIRAVLADVDEERMQRLGRAFVATHLDRITQSHVLRRLREHQADGHHVVLASASPQFVVEPAARHLGFDRVICTRVERGEDGRWELRGVNVRADAKRRALEQACQELRPRRTWAYGDSRDDLPMLRWADHGFLVRRRDLAPVPPDDGGRAEPAVASSPVPGALRPATPASRIDVRGVS